MNLRKKIAREAANLLYSGVEKEYRQAKLKAAETFGAHFLPANLEVAVELDKIIEENEGSARPRHLVQMRREALKIMKILNAFNPVLIGSVWRGTIHRKSDIDIIVYHDEPSQVTDFLEENQIRILHTEWMSVTKQGQKKTAFHMYLESSATEEIEIVVRAPEEAGHNEKCEIYGDEITGLRIQELEKLLKEDATKRFLPMPNH